MKKKIILIICFLVFSLSSLVMILISIEDKKDLSGRAAKEKSLIIPENLRKEYGGEVWNGEGKSLNYNSNLWENSGDSFWNRKTNLIIRIVNSEKNVGELMPKDNKLIGINGERNEDGWTIKSFEYKFLNKTKNGEYWNNGELGLLVLGDMSIDQNSVKTLINGFSEESLVQGVNSYGTEEKIVEMNKPSVVKIGTKMCDELKVIKGYKTVDGRSYTFCMNATGSGFFVSGEGYIATNGHVVRAASYEERILAAVLTGGLDDFLTDILKMQFELMGLDINSTEVNNYILALLTNRGEMLRMASLLISDYEDGFVGLGEVNYEYVVGLGKTPIEVDSGNNFNKASDIREATLIGYDYEEMNDDGSFKSSDVAILKIDGRGYPALPLGNSDDLSQGTKIQVMGYPGVVDGGKNSFLNESAEVTVTGGVVSSIKTAKGDGKKLIQTDASITHGNSGGPAMDSQGNVIGIATYAVVLEDGGGNYNFLRDIADLKNLAGRLGIEIGSSDTYAKWKEGLNNYWRSYYKYAKSDFVDVKTNYTGHLLVDNYLNEVDGLVGTKEDLTPRFSKSQRDMIRLGSGIVMAGSIMVGLGVSVFGKKNEPMMYA